MNKRALCSLADNNTQADAVALKQAQRLDKHLTSTDARVHDLAKHIYDGFIKGRNAPSYLNLREHIVTLIVNLFSAYMNDPQRYVRYSRDPKRYNESRYNVQPITWRKLCRVVSALTANHLIEHRMGIPAPRPEIPEEKRRFADGRQSRIRALPTLIRLMNEEFKLSSDMIKRADEELIVLRGRKSAEGYAYKIDYRDSRELNAMRRNVDAINQRLSRTWIDLYISDETLLDLNQRMGSNESGPIDFHRKHLQRIFNNKKFLCGGRFYHGWWQEVPKEMREHIRINGESTVEIDFTGVHYCIFYRDVPGGAPADPYRVPGVLTESDRNIAKKALNAMVNASSRKAAVGAVRRESQKWPLPKAYANAGQLVSALVEMHKPIAHLFFTGEGLAAQRIESQIAERILLRLAEDGIPVLPVHDSFVIAERHAARLCAEMLEAFEAITGGKCTAKLKMPTRKVAPPLVPHKRYEVRRSQWQRDEVTRLSHQQAQDKAASQKRKTGTGTTRTSQACC